MIVKREIAADHELVQFSKPIHEEDKFSRHFLDTRYVAIPAGADGHGRRVRFCYSSHRNMAGFFLGWREVISASKIKRDMWAARRVRGALALLATKRAEAFRATN